MVCLLEHLTDAATEGKTVDEEKKADENNTPFPSIAERVSHLEEENRELRDTIMRLRRAHHASIIPSDALDLALAVGVVAIFAYILKAVVSKN